MTARVVPAAGGAGLGYAVRRITGKADADIAADAAGRPLSYPPVVCLAPHRWPARPSAEVQHCRAGHPGVVPGLDRGAGRIFDGVRNRLLPMGAAPPKYYQSTIKVLFRTTTRSLIKILSKYYLDLAGSWLFEKGVKLACLDAWILLH